MEAFCDHKKKLLKWKNYVGVIDIPSKKKVRKGQSKEQDSDNNDVTDVQQEDEPDETVQACITTIPIDQPYSQDVKKNVPS